jgi:hypothetical protein
LFGSVLAFITFGHWAGERLTRVPGPNCRWPKSGRGLPAS